MAHFPNFVVWYINSPHISSDRLTEVIAMVAQLYLFACFNLAKLYEL